MPEICSDFVHLQKSYKKKSKKSYLVWVVIMTMAWVVIMTTAWMILLTMTWMAIMTMLICAGEVTKEYKGAWTQSRLWWKRFKYNQ